MWQIENRAVLMLLLFSISACERRTEVRLQGGNPPTFILSGSGVLGGLRIYGPEPERFRSPRAKDNVVWEINAADLRGEFVEKLHEITYGVVPKGYKQLAPEQGNAPPLIPGKHYRYDFVTGEAPGAIGYFEIRDGVAVTVEGPSECIEIRENKVIPIECPENIIHERQSENAD